MLENAVLFWQAILHFRRTAVLQMLATYCGCILLHPFMSTGCKWAIKVFNNDALVNIVVNIQIG
jgi:hypothetical protein